MDLISNTLRDNIGQEYVIANEKPRNKRNKRNMSKSVIALAIAAATMPITTSALAAYADPGVIGDKTSWETPEYQKDWGLAAMKASSAYALGFYGQGVKVGVMDSGAVLFSHPDLNADRFHAVEAAGEYGSSGLRYPQLASGQYTAGEAYDISGQWIQGVNDGHGTHVTGTVGANRDGNEMHGVAWGADVYVGNTGGTDNNNYGPYQDYQFFYTGWKAIVDSGAQVINNSWGTNIRVINNGSTGSDGGSTGVHIPANTNAQSEYEYFYFNKIYGDNPSFVDAAYDAVKGTNVVQVFTTGNRDFANPFYRALYPYYNPEAEKHWVAVAGLRQLADGNYSLVTTWNEAGNAKWWTVAAPGNGIYSTTVNATSGALAWGTSSGTSMSAPHVTGAMGVLLSRYQDMTAMQARDVMFTTASHQNPDGSTFIYWTAADGVPDVRYGWGVPDLDKGMYGPGQLLGNFEYNLASTPLDVWSNDISQNALNARELEDLAWLQSYRADGIAAGGAYELGTSFVVDDGNADVTDHIINQADAEKLRLEYYEKRAESIQAKIDAGLYDGSLVKQGAGTLVMTGDNTYQGGTTVEKGTLYGFTESFGSNTVMVNGGKFGVIANYTDTFTLKGDLTSTASHKANIDVNSGGTYVVSAGEDVSVGALTFKEGSMLTVGSISRDVYEDAYNLGITSTGSVTADVLTDADKAMIAPPDYAFFETDVAINSNVLTASFGRNEDVNFASYADFDNGRAIAETIENAGAGDLYHTLLSGTKSEVRNTYNALGSDFYLNVQNASIVNALTMSRTVKDEALGMGTGRSAELADGNARLWTAGIGSWSDVDYGQSSMDVDFYAALVGAEVDVADSTKIGLYFGAGSTDFNGGTYGKVDSDDLHFGLYGVSKVADVASLSYGVMHTHQDRDAMRNLVVGSTVGPNAVSTEAQITQFFAEAAYTGFNTDAYSVEPYAGLNWMHIKSDNYTETVDNMRFTTNVDNQDLQITTLGLRAALPFNVSDVKMALKCDVYGMHFFGDNTPEANMQIADTGVARIKGGELSNMFGVGLGVETQLGKSATLGVSYAGAYNSDITSNGVYAKLKVSF